MSIFFRVAKTSGFVKKRPVALAGLWFYNRTMQNLSALDACPGPFPCLHVLVGLVKLAALHGPLIFFCLQISRTVFKDADALTRAISGFAIYFLLAGAGCLVVPLSFFLLLSWSLFWGAAGVVFFFKTRREEFAGSGDSAGWFFLGAVSVFPAALLVAGLWDPALDHDPLTYQLHFAASWIKSGHVGIVPTPFGDPSHAYGPQLASLFYVWLLAPLPSDMLAINGGWFFLLLLLLACSGLARELGAEQGREWIAALFIFLCPLLVHQGQSALNDVGVSAFFVVSLFFLVRCIRKGSGPELFAGLMSAGLLAGCKYTAAPLALLLVPLLVAGFVRVKGKRAFFAFCFGLAAAFVGGGWWYVRNWTVTGSPVFPLEVGFGGSVLFHGLYGSEQMKGWVYHEQGVVAWLETVFSVCSPGLILAGAIACAGVFLQRLSFLKKERLLSVAIIYISLMPLIIDRLLWNALPFQVNRFWIPWAALLCALCGAFFSRRVLAAAVVAGLSWAALFAMPETSSLPAGEPHFTALLAAGSIAAGLVAQLVFRNRPGWQQRTRHIVYGACTVVALVVLAWLFHGFPARRAEHVQSFEYGKGWAFIGSLDKPLTISYTGANTPYFLHGPRLSNRVVYTGTSGKVMPQPHRFMAELADRDGYFNTPEPMVSNLELCPRKWMQALSASKVDYFFVMRMPQYPLLNAAHVLDDNKAWPMEDAWARTCPRHFRQVYHDGFNRVYKLDFDPDRGKPCSLEAGCESRPLDAVSACRYKGRGADSACRRYFPGAPRALSVIEAAP